jgi:K(+)-stimulated pyrophosphate-energized sodium pump
MRTWLATAAFEGCRAASGLLKKGLGLAALVALSAAGAWAQPGGEPAGGEASLKLPDLASVPFLNGAIDGHKLLMIGIAF